MANHSGETPAPPSDDFLDQILGFNPGYGGGAEDGSSMMLQLGSGHDFGSINNNSNACAYGGGAAAGCGFPLGLSLEHDGIGKSAHYNNHASGTGKRLFPDDHPVSHTPTSSVKRVGERAGFEGQQMMMRSRVPSHQAAAAAAANSIRPRIRARRGQATDPHSIAERLRREKIAERARALQELVPTVNKTDRAVMVDEIVDYVKFLRLQVKVLSMSRVGGAGAVMPLVTGIPATSSTVEAEEGRPGLKEAWEKWSINEDGTERQVAKLMMEEKVGAAMQFLQSKSLCIMPISLASAIYHTHTTTTSNSNTTTPPNA